MLKGQKGGVARSLIDNATNHLQPQVLPLPIGGGVPSLPFPQDFKQIQKMPSHSPFGFPQLFQLFKLK